MKSCNLHLHNSVKTFRHVTLTNAATSSTACCFRLATTGSR